MATTLNATILCPACGAAAVITMPTDRCVFFYECGNCRTVLRPLAGDCCVFCSYGNTRCPSMQEGSDGPEGATE